MELEVFVAKFHVLKAQGFVPSLRRGNTGVGYTLETLLGITENNVSHPDLGRYELKAHRDGSTSLITLFTFNRVMPPLEAVRRYGSYDATGRLGLYYTLGFQPNSAGLFVDVDEMMLRVCHVEGTVVVQWSLDAIVERFMQKVPRLIFVTALVEKRHGQEYFHYHRAQLLQGTSADVLLYQLKAQQVLLDLRVHDQIGRARNHGTAFRTYESTLPTLFRHVEELA